jgi:DNA-binding XRE family transcriptional regulator
MRASNLREWRQRVGLTQSEAAAKIGVTRGTIQNWESEATAIPPMVEASCQIWEDRLWQIRPDIGPVTLIYSDGPMFINPYGPRSRLAMMHQEPYPTNAAAIARVRALWGREDFHNPFIIDQSRKFLWNSVQLARVADGSDQDAPLWRKVVIAKADREEFIAHVNVKSLINACARAFRAKGLPKDVIIFRDKSTNDDYILYFSPAAFALTPEIREIADSVVFHDEPDDLGDLAKIEL